MNKASNRRLIQLLWYINLLLLALFIFANIWLNIYDSFAVFNIQEAYKVGISVIFVLGIARIIDAGTGVNNIIIGTSTFWRFEFVSGIILLFLRIPATYLLIKNFGIIGAGFAEVISLTIYNFIRFEYLRRKFGMQPFNRKTALSILVSAVAFFITWALFRNIHGWVAIVSRSLTFTTILVSGIFYLRLTPDAMQMYYKVKEKWSR